MAPDRKGEAPRGAKGEEADRRRARIGKQRGRDEQRRDRHEADEAALDRMRRFRKRLVAVPRPLRGISRHEYSPDANTGEHDRLADVVRQVPQPGRGAPVASQRKHAEHDPEKGCRNGNVGSPGSPCVDAHVNLPSPLRPPARASSARRACGSPPRRTSARAAGRGKSRPASRRSRRCRSRSGSPILRRPRWRAEGRRDRGEYRDLEIDAVGHTEERGGEE